MNILFISDFFQPYSTGASNISTYLIAKELSKKNNCYVITQKFRQRSWKYKGLDVYPYLERYSADSSLKSILTVEVFSILKLKNFFSFYKTISNFCKQKHIDVINVQSNNLILLIALLITNKPIVIDVRDYFFTCRFMLKTIKCDKHHLFCLPSNSTKRVHRLPRLASVVFFRLQSILYYLEKNILLKPLLKIKRGKYVFVPNSKYVSNKLKEEFGSLDVDVKVIHNPINVNDYKHLQKPKKRTILFASALENAKGIWNCIYAFEKIQDNILFEIAGDGPEIDPVREYINKKGLKNIKLLGKLEYQKIPMLYQKAYITIQPSVWPEPFGRYILESFASGTPLITTPTGGSREAIKDRETGLLVPPDQPQKLTDAMSELLSNKALYNHIQKNIIREAEKYKPDLVAEQRIALYTKLS